MQLNHFADPFQNGHADVNQFFSESNRLTDQNPGFDNGVGYGYTQNTSGYEWGNETGEGGASTPINATGCEGGSCGADPAALTRANLQWEQRGENTERFNGNHGGEQSSQSESEPAPAQAITDYLYHIGPDALDFDVDTDVTASSMEYWKKRVPSLIIGALTVLSWCWIWSHFGISKMLTSTISSAVYWGFIVITLIGAFQTDHRAARYEEEREQLVATDVNLQMVLRVIGASVTLLIVSKVLDGKSAAIKQTIYITLAIAFFTSLIGGMSFPSKKRGESVRRYRKIKAAILNLAIALITVSALLTFNLGGPTMNGGGMVNSVTPQVIYVDSSKGGGGNGKKGKKSSGSSGIEYVYDAPKTIVHVPAEPIHVNPPTTAHYGGSAPTTTQYGSTQSGGSSTTYPVDYAPTVLQPNQPVNQPPGPAY